MPNCIVVSMSTACHVRSNVAPVTNDSGVDLRAVEADVTACRGSHASLVEHLRSLEPVAPTTPSRLPGWTVAHVLTHIARNADGHLSMLAGRPQYPHGVEGRNSDIEVGAHRAWDDLITDVERTCALVDEAYARCDDWSGTVELVMGARPKVMIPFLRQREVEIHHVDLGLGHEFGDLPSEYLRKELRLMGMLWKARKPMGMTPLPEAALALPPSTRLAWMMGRIEIDGLAPANLF
jgi:maleylpyruvate isomerase